MSNLELWLVRHGESTANTGIWSSKPETISLTERGKKQAFEAAEKIIKKPDIIISSPFKRAQESAEPFLNRWPEVAFEIWPIQEFTYLCPKKYENATPSERKAAIQRYWQNLDPFFCDQEETECFSDFIKRVKEFHESVLTKAGYVVAIGHGQFFKAYQISLSQGFNATNTSMKEFRIEETTNPLANGEIVKLLINK